MVSSLARAFELATSRRVVVARARITSPRRASFDGGFVPSTVVFYLTQRALRRVAMTRGVR